MAVIAEGVSNVWL